MESMQLGVQVMATDQRRRIKTYENHHLKTPFFVGMVAAGARYDKKNSSRALEA